MDQLTYFGRSVMPKGIQLRKKCGQIKTQEHYQHPDNLFTLGYSILSTPSNAIGGMQVFIPSLVSLAQYGQVLIDVLLYSDSQVIILLQSVLRSVLEKARPQIRRQLKEILFGSLNSRCLIFYNENNKRTFRARRVSVNESMINYQNRLFEVAADYLRVLLTSVGSIGSLTVVLADRSKDPLCLLCEPSSQGPLSTLKSLTVMEFLSAMGPAEGLSSSKQTELMAAVTSAVENVLAVDPISATAGTSNAISKPRQIFSRHLTRAELRRGLSTGVFQCGVLSVFAHSFSEAEALPSSLTLKSATASTGFSSVLISGLDLMNRAIHGDSIVFEMLPNSEWRSMSKHVLLEDSDEDGTSIVEEIEGETNEAYSHTDMAVAKAHTLRHTRVPTARVVGILKRNTEEIAATIPFKKSSGPDSFAKKSSAGSDKEASFEVSNRDEYVLCIPLDRRLPRVRIVTRQWEKLQGQRVIVAIDDWPSHSKFPNGHFVRSLGPSGDWKTELEALMLKHSVFPRPFSTEAMACLPNVLCSNDPLMVPQTSGIRDKPKAGAWVDSKWQLPSVEGRRDIRQDTRVFSVDPPGCQDIDDAMSVTWIKDGVIEVGIHIADVCAFVAQGSALDSEAQARSTTVYLTHARIDMLPSLISSDIASLHGDKDRYAVSVLFHVHVTHKKSGAPVTRDENMIALDEDGDINFSFSHVPTWAGRTAIHSVAAMTYDQAHNLVHGMPPDAEGSPVVPEGQAGCPVNKLLWEPLKQDLIVLTAFSRHLKHSREEKGALDLTLTEGGQLKFKLDQDGFPVQVSGSDAKEIHETIAELMILANCAVARLIHSELPSASLLRVHPPPSLQKIQEVQELAESIGLRGLFSGTTNEEIQREAREFKATLRRDNRCNEGVVNFITAAVIRCMSAARYECSTGELTGGSQDPHKIDLLSSDADEQVMHYGLGLSFYTHFTSPIRRYADVIVHRQLLAVLEFKASPHIASDRRAAISTNGEHFKKASLPSSQVISIVDEASLSTDVEYGRDDDHHVQMKRAPDGRMLIDKVKVSKTAEVEPPPVSVQTPYLVPTPSIINPVVFTTEDNDELNFLDDLLGDVGASLMETVIGGLAPAMQAAPLVEGGVGDIAGSDNMDYELDLMLGDVSIENGLIAKDTVASVHTTEADLRSDTSLTAHDSNAAASVDGDKWGRVGRIISEDNACDEDLLKPPYPPVQLSRIADHLNAMNKRAKMAQFECQELYLRHYFTQRQELHWAVVYALKENGFLAFVPAFDHKGPVFLTDSNNVTVCCLPSLVGMKQSDGQEISPGAYKGNTEVPRQGNDSVGVERVRAFPELKCVMLASGSEGNSVDELVICPKNAVPSECGSGRGVLRLHYLQHVQVLISSVPPGSNNNQIGIPQLCLQLAGLGSLDGNVDRRISGESPVALNDKKKKNDSTVRETAMSSGLLEQKEGDAGDIQQASLYKAWTQYRRTYFAEEKRRSLTCTLDEVEEYNRITTARNAKRVEKAQKAVKDRRHMLHGTGHVAFGPVESLSPLFLLQGSDGKGMPLSQDEQESKDTAQLLRGKAAAMHQMKAWGEEWAEEEDLPSGSAGGGQEGGGDGTVDVSKYNLGRETAMATQRIHKLKTAKRNSKY